MTTLSTATAPHVASNLDEVEDWFGARVAEIDADRAPTRGGLGWLGERGLLDLGAPGLPGSLADMVAIVRAVARQDLASAFSVWAHRAVIEYLARWGGERDAGTLDALRRGARPGSTAMASAFQQAAGLGELTVTATPIDGGWRLDGQVRWASNLYPDTVVVLPAATTGSRDPDDGHDLVVALPLDREGVEVRDEPPLLALQATRSSSIRLEGIEVTGDEVLTERIDPFLASVRPAFLLLQSAFCLGLAEAAAASARDRLDGAAAVFAEDADSLEGRLRTSDARLAALAAEADASTTACDAGELLALRLEVAGLAGEATTLETTVAGGAGYLRTSPTARRLREAAFLPVQSPTEAQLRWELSRSA
ncbi:acyl-CoA dehydrogenase [Egibacter rhizosphaerae]|uniref:Acyl-CoA dehydrogenase n=1 Tax=Egibacter rhizosphaerae TaxID=1670831 RepID=A0A411YE46_9ACTN|nr:acyl-CoA dehydrogenase family protein [Egibacter rhizosphaerae]QBI19478.1 acyl-CoA dehydrogenase [Egibacter rhizosphaerae]